MLAARTTLGPYEILGLLGAGGMGEVYRARDTRLGREVAIKVIPTDLARDPERIRRFEQEARAAGALNHPNVCATYDIGSHEGSPFVVMELLEGESLRHRLEHGPIPVRKAIDYAAQAARGLAAAHEKGIVHRDLKPENLFVTKDGRIKVLDFGLAKLTRPEVLAPAGDKTISTAGTETGAILGTVGYMAPEQARGQSADARSDLFALGAVLYEMLAGKRPFHGVSYVETLHSILNDEPPPLSASGREIPLGLEPIVRHCLEKSPGERFQGAHDLAFALESVSGIVSGTTLAATAQGAPAKARFRFGSAAAGFLAGALLIAAIAFVLVRRAHRIDPSRLTYSRLTLQRGSIASARFSPEGRTVFYCAAWDGGPLQIFETQADFPAPRAVGVAGTKLLSISPSGTLAVLLGVTFRAPGFWDKGGTLAEVPISGGAPRRVLDDVEEASWLPDGKTLAVTHRVGEKVRLEMPLGHVLYETTGGVNCIRVSRDGQRVAFVDRPQLWAGNGGVVIMDNAGRITARTAGWGVSLGLAWSADDREVWFCRQKRSDRGSQHASELRAVSPNGTERVLASVDGSMTVQDVGKNGQVLLIRSDQAAGVRGRMSPADEERELTWYDWSIAVDISADGRSLLLDTEGMGGGPNNTAYLRGMDGSPPVRLGEGVARSLSPDGKWALVLRGSVGNPRLVLLPTGVGDSISVPRGKIDHYQGTGWLPDGKSIVVDASEAGHERRTHIQDLAGELPRPITPEGTAGTAVSPDGRFVAAVSRDRRLYICPTTGDSPRLVAELPPQEDVLQWRGHSSIG